MPLSIMKTRIALIAVVSCLSAAAAAAQDVTPVAQDPAPNQIESFEGSLRRAIDSAASKLAQRVRTALPTYNLTFQYQTPPIVTGAMLSDTGAIFHVLIPAAITDIDLTTIRAIQANQARQTTGRPVNNSAIDTPLPLANPIEEYTTLVKTALYDAMLDNALSLPIPAGQQLTIIADELQTQPANPFEPRSRTLILQIKGEDLAALRVKSITRDEAKARIKESKFPN